MTLEELQSLADTELIEKVAVEVWKPIFRYGGMYEVSSRGRIRSYKNGRWLPLKEPRLLKPTVNKEGYRYVQLRRDGKTYAHKVSILVATTFLPNPMGLPIVNHCDGVKTNDAMTNLEWCTQGHNLRHAYRTGLKIPVRGEQSPHAKLSRQDVRTIRRMGKQQYSLREIADCYPVSHTTIKKILSLSKWKHVA